MIELLIGVLDRLEPDPDFEPSLGWTAKGGLGQLCSSDDREEDFEVECVEYLIEQTAAGNCFKRNGGLRHG
jgi:hypothetical protein